MKPNCEDRIFGCLLAGAIGDALGARFENQESFQFSIPVDLRITDDTQLTLATCEAIVDQGKVEPEAIASQMANWFSRRRITGIGSSTLKALTELNAGGHWAMVGATGERSAGNGAAMRISPLAFFLNPDVKLDRQKIRDVATITHRNDEAYLGALAVIRVIRADVLDRGVIEMLIEKLPDSRMRDRFIEIQKCDLDSKRLSEKHSPSGYVVDSVPFSVLSAIEFDDFMTSVQRIVESGGDTDTTGAIFGNIVGSFYGAGILPIDVAKKIDELPVIKQMATNLFRITDN